jgi:hypothetical protein
MARYVIQEYNQEMTMLTKERECVFDCDGEAVTFAHEYAEGADGIVILWRRNSMDKTRLMKIAKFY